MKIQKRSQKIKRANREVQTRTVKLAENKVVTMRLSDEKDSSAFESGVRRQLGQIGVSGTEVNGGYFAEEYLRELRGRRGARTWDEMRRSEAQVSMILKGIINPLKAADWTFESPDLDDVPDGELHAEFLEEIFKVGMDWETFLHEMFTFIPFGNSVFEVIHSVVLGHPKFGDFNGIKSLAFRAQKTIERWNLERQTGRLLSVEQFVSSDVSEAASYTIPGEFLLVFSLDKEGDNYEGISLLRPMYGAYFRKNLYLKIAAIGIEKNAIGTPIATVPAGKDKTKEFEKLKQILEDYTSHENAFIAKPEGWGIEIHKGEFDAASVKEMITLENTEMANAALANFLVLGMNGGGGAYALGSDLSDIFLSSIQAFGNFACGVINRQLIPNMIKLKYGPQRAYPKLKVSGVNDKAGTELAEIISKGVNDNIVQPDERLEDWFRRQYKLPVKDATTVRQPLPKASPFGGGSPAQVVDPNVDTDPDTDVDDDFEITDDDEKVELSEKRVKLAESYKKKFDSLKENSKEVMQAGLREMLDAMKKKLKAEYKKATPQARLTLGTKIEATGINAYRDKIREALAEAAIYGLDSAKKELPRRVTAKLSEKIKTVKLSTGYYAALPVNVRKRIVDVQSSLISMTQAADLQKAVAFQFTSSANSTEDIDQILRDIEEKAGALIEGSTASGSSIDAAAANSISSSINQARLEIFFDPEVFETIESFTFQNEDPVSEICQELDGTTWAADDPAVDRFSPPLHHNCKSRLIPNMKGDEGNPDVVKGTTSITEKAAKAITLSENCKCDYHLGGDS